MTTMMMTKIEENRRFLAHRRILASGQRRGVQGGARPPALTFPGWILQVHSASPPGGPLRHSARAIVAPRWSFRWLSHGNSDGSLKGVGKHARRSSVASFDPRHGMLSSKPVGSLKPSKHPNGRGKGGGTSLATCEAFERAQDSKPMEWTLLPRPQSSWPTSGNSPRNMVPPPRAKGKPSLGHNGPNKPSWRGGNKKYQISIWPPRPTAPSGQTRAQPGPLWAEQTPPKGFFKLPDETEQKGEMGGEAPAPMRPGTSKHPFGTLGVDSGDIP